MIGVDSCILVAGVHGDHPLHDVAIGYLIRNLKNDLVVCHHSILESYSVLTRLPGKLRLSSLEAQKLLTESIKPNMKVAGFKPDSIWDSLDIFVGQGVVGGRAYDAFIADILIKAGVETIVTFNGAHFKGFGLVVIDPSK